MSFCRKCGMRLPEGEEVRFCPNCGASLVSQTIYETKTVEVRAPKERKAGITSHRVAIAAIVFVLCLLATFLGVVSSVDPSEAQIIFGDVDELRQALTISGIGVALIFGNNMMQTLIMFIPGLGPIWGFYVLYNTGRVFAAAGLVSHIDPLILFASTLALPFAWMEYISYSLAVSESLILVYAAVKRRFRSELVNASKFIAVCAVILLLAAFIETALILSQLP